MKLLTATLLAACAVSALAEQPKPTTYVDFSLYAGVLATRTADYITTENVLAGGGRELLLPKGLVENKPAFAAFSIGVGVAEIYASRRLRTHHPRLARYVLLTDIVAAGVVAAHNEAIVPRKVVAK